MKCEGGGKRITATGLCHTATVGKTPAETPERPPSRLHSRGRFFFFPPGAAGRKFKKQKNKKNNDFVKKQVSHETSLKNEAAKG